MYYSTSIHKDGTKEIALTDAFSAKEIVKAMGFKFNGYRKTWNKAFNTTEELCDILVDLIIAVGMSKYDAQQFLYRPLSFPEDKIALTPSAATTQKLHAYLKTAKKF